MAKDRFKGIENIKGLLQAMGVQEAPEKTPVQEAREALRRYSAQETEKIYANASKVIGRELEFSSARHLATGLFGLLTDGVYTLWGPIKEVIQSPMVKEMIEEKVGKGKTLVDYLVANKLKGKTEEEKTKAVAEFNKSIETIKRGERHPQNLADYCQQTGRSPDAVLRSAKDRMVVVEKTYGSVEEYERVQVEAIKGLSKLLGQLDALENMPFNLLIPMIIAKKGEVEDLAQIGVNLNVLVNIAQSYIRDIAKFGKAFLTEYAKHSATEIEQYKALKSKTAE